MISETRVAPRRLEENHFQNVVISMIRTVNLYVAPVAEKQEKERGREEDGEGDHWTPASRGDVSSTEQFTM